MRSLLPHFVEEDYDHGPFKLICDDLGLANLIVKSEEDLTVVGVVDFEWSYIGPADGHVYRAEIGSKEAVQARLGEDEEICCCALVVDSSAVLVVSFFCSPWK